MSRDRFSLPLLSWSNVGSFSLARRTGCNAWAGPAVAAALAALMAIAPLSGCGGGVGEGGTGYASGPITGFGSVIVNDIVFDDSLAQVEDGDGSARTRADLRLGMTVEVDSGTIAGGGAQASRVRFDSAIVGPVEAIEADGFVVLGQRVAVDETTVFDSTLAAGLSALVAGQVVEVYGLYDAGVARFRATRVEVRTGALVYRLRGIVADLDDRTRTLRIGTALFGYGAVASVPADLAIGRFVRLFVSTDAPGVIGRRQVLRFGEAQRVLPDILGDGFSAKGHVTRFTSLSDLWVDGRPVDASTAVVSGTLALGARVEVRGSLRAGIVIATRVDVRSDQAERDRGFELRGRIDRVAADRTSIELRGITVGLTRPPVYQDGTAADLAVGRSVEVRGIVSVGDGARLDALVVKFR